MARPKKPTYEYVEKLGRYRKRIRDLDGRYVAIYGKTPEELTAKLAEAQRLIEEGKARAAMPITVAEYAEKWIELNTGDMRGKTLEAVLNAIRNHVIPVIGSMPLYDVMPDDARKVMSALDGKSKSLRGKVLVNMRKIFDAAVDNNLIRANPCAKLRAGGTKPTRKEALTESQIKTLLEAVEGTRAETFVKIALYTGLRREEALALKWDCVELDGEVPYLKVRRALHWIHSRPVVDELLKTDAACRTVPLPEQLQAHLRALEPKTGYLVSGEEALTQTQWKHVWRAVTSRQTGEKEYWEYTPHGRERHTVQRILGEKCRGGDWCYTIDFPVTPHLLRHTYCTMLILAGANIKRVQYLMGHADIQVTLDIYSHVAETTPEIMVEEVKKAFGG